MSTPRTDPPAERRPISKYLLRVPVLYPNAYVWLVFVSAMDVIMTRIVLAYGGSEVNPVAELVIRGGGLWGLIVFKFAIIAGVIILCEIIGRHKYRTGKRLSIFGVIVSAIPSLWAFILLFTHEPATQDEQPPAVESRLVQPTEQPIVRIDASVPVMRYNRHLGHTAGSS